MITLDNINTLHDKYNSLAAEADLVADRNMNMLLMFALDSEFMDLDGDRLVFTQGQGPLRSIEIERIAGAEDLGSHVAVFLPNSVILVKKADGQVSVVLPD